MKSIKYVTYREDHYIVAQALNVDVSSFGHTVEEAVENLQDAVTLYLKDEDVEGLFHTVDDVVIGEAQINA